MRKIGIKIFILSIAVCAAAFFIFRAQLENRQLRKIIERLAAESRVAEVLVTDVRTDPATGQTQTTIKFLEYDTKQNPLTPKYFTFLGNIIQFQSLVIRFDDFYIKGGHPLKGKSAYIFMMAFTLNNKRPEIFEINKIDDVPCGYKIDGVSSDFQKKLWKRFWEYALQPKEAKRMGIKNAQIEAPGTKFIKGLLYTLKIEHDGGLRIDAQPLPKILDGEKLEF
jgi:hypothetical protein